MLTWQQEVTSVNDQLCKTWSNEDDWRGVTYQDYTDAQKQYEATILVARMLAALLDKQKIKVV